MNERIRLGQQRLIFATAAKVGLRDEQLYDMVEYVSGSRTRLITALTMLEARRLIGIVKKMERNVARIAAEGRAAAPARETASEDLIQRAAQRAAGGASA